MAWWRPLVALLCAFVLTPEHSTAPHLIRFASGAMIDPVDDVLKLQALWTSQDRDDFNHLDRCDSNVSCSSVHRDEGLLELQARIDSSASTTSVWPLFRDLDLLRLIEEGSETRDAGGPAASASRRCRRDLHDYLLGLRNFSLWAVQMWDSSVRAPRGALWGEVVHLGNFDECMSAGRESGRGCMYCLTTLEIAPREDSPQADRARGSAWQKLKVARHRTRWGMCLPASCAPDLIGAVLGEPLAARAARFNLSASLTAEADLCQQQPPVGQQAAAAGSDSVRIFWNLLYFYLIWMLICNIFDCFYPASAGPFVRSFSVRSHWRALLHNGSNPDEIFVIHGVRVIGIALVVLGHRGEALMAAPIINGGEIEKLYSNLTDVMLFHGSVVVDAFFVVGGCLQSWTLLDYLRKGKNNRLSPVNLFVHRYLRLTPAYAAAIAFLALGLPAVGSGPLWKAIVVEQAHRCQDRWWTNLLYISNMVRPDKPCLDPGWYLACDMQLFLGGVFLVQWLHDRPHSAGKVLTIGLILAALYPAAVTLLLGLEGSVIPAPANLGDMAATPEHIYLYVQALCRAGPYIVGIGTGWYLRTSKNQFPKSAHAWPAWLDLVMAALALAPGALGVLFYPPLDAVTPRLVHAAYAGLHRIVFAMVIAYVIVVASRGRNDWLSRALSSPPLHPLSRLSYCVFLTHYVVQIHLLGQQRTLGFLSSVESVSLAVSDIFWSVIAGLVLHLTVEAPVNAVFLAWRSMRRPPCKTVDMDS